jgi:hypothetical protein
MNAAGFAERIAGIGFLDGAQRGEAGGPMECSACPLSARTRPGKAEAAGTVSTAEVADAAPDEDPLSKVGRGRISSFGCSHCGGEGVHPWSKAGGMPRYRYAGCCRPFNPLIGTPSVGLHHRERRNYKAQALIDGEAADKAAKRRKIAYDAAARISPATSISVNLDKSQHLSSIVEAHEASVRVSFKDKGQMQPSSRSIASSARRWRRYRSWPLAKPPRLSNHRRPPAPPRRCQFYAHSGAGHFPPCEIVLRGGLAIIAFARRARVNVPAAPSSQKDQGACTSYNNVNTYGAPRREWVR